MNCFLSVRMTNKLHKQFNQKVCKFGTPSDVLRELVQAFVDDRVVIIPSTKGNLLEELYEPRT